MADIHRGKFVFFGPVLLPQRRVVDPRGTGVRAHLAGNTRGNKNYN
jgi:hypothetical protein